MEMNENISANRFEELHAINLQQKKLIADQHEINKQLQAENEKQKALITTIN